MKWAIGIVAYSMFFMGIGAITVKAMDDRQVPRLVGFQCDGSSGTLYADEEDSFPTKCKEIKDVSYVR